MSYKNTYILWGEKILTVIHCTYITLMLYMTACMKKIFTATSGLVHFWCTVLPYL